MSLLKYIMQPMGSPYDFREYWATLDTAVVEDEAPDEIVLTFIAPPDTEDFIPDSAWSVRINGKRISISDVSWEDEVVTLTVAQDVIFGDEVVVTLRNGGSVDVESKVVPDIAISNLRVIEQRAGEIDFEWDIPSGLTPDMVDGYKVYQSDDGENYSIAGTTAEESYTVDGLTRGQLYFFYVVPYKGDVEFKPSEIYDTAFKFTIDASLFEDPLESSSVALSSSFDGTIFIDWGEGVISEETSSVGISTSHAYPMEGEYQIRIWGDLYNIKIGLGVEAVSSIDNWGSAEWDSFAGSFKDAINMVGKYKDVPNTANVESFDDVFNGCKKFNSRFDFHSDYVYGHNRALMGCELFNQPVSISGPGESFADFLRGCKAFNSSLTFSGGGLMVNFSRMLYGCENFNQPVNIFCEIASVIATSMFEGCIRLNSPVAVRSGSRAVYAKRMLANCTALNQPVAITGGEFGFEDESQEAPEMLLNCTSFNSTITFNYRLVNLKSFLEGAVSFNQSLAYLDVAYVTDMENMLDGTAMSVSNYSATLIAWAAQEVQEDVVLGALGLKYNPLEASGARSHLIEEYNWTIVGDDAADPVEPTPTPTPTDPEPTPTDPEPTSPEPTDPGPDHDFVPPVYGGTGNTYYVDANGTDSAGRNGSVAQPWASLAYACTRVTTSGDIIHINAGNYVESSESVLAAGVSIEGAGKGLTNIESRRTGDHEFLITLTSGSENTTGNQHISGISFDGYDLRAWGAIYVAARSRVAIHDCTFDDFKFTAVILNGRVAMWDEGEPTHYALDNLFYGNDVVNCCERATGADWMSGALHIGGQEGLRIFDCYFDETSPSRASSHHGYCIKYYNAGYNRGLKIHNNHFKKPPSTTYANDWNFAIELWQWSGGIEIYDNRIEGSIDIDHVRKTKYAFGTIIRDNEFGYDSLPPSSNDWANLSAGLYVEFSCDSIIIKNNTFKNVESFLRFSPRTGDSFTNIFVHGNIINRIGNTAGDAGTGLVNFIPGAFTINNMKFINNTFYMGNLGGQYGMIFQPGTYLDNIDILNNIFMGAGTRPIEFNGSNTGRLNISNNCFSGNGSNAPNVTGSPANYTNQNNITTSPQLVDAANGDFNLSLGSPCIGAGQVTDVAEDFNNYPFGTPPSIGALEYGSEPVEPTPTDPTPTPTDPEPTPTDPEPTPTDPEPTGSEGSPLLNDLIAYYKFEESSGDLIDSHTNGLDGTVSAGITRGATGVSGNCYQMVRANSTYIDLGNNPLLQPEDEFTMSIWFNTVLTEFQGLFCNGISNQDLGFEVILTEHGGIEYKIGDGVNVIAEDLTWEGAQFRGLNDGNWHHLVMTFVDSTVRIYLDGALLYTESDQNLTAIDYSTGHLILGARGSDYGGGLGRELFFDGLLDESFIAGHAWTLAEVQEHHDNGACLTYPFE